MVLSLALGLLLPAVAVLGQTETDIDPRDDPRNPLRYIPSTALAVIAGILYLIVPAACVVWSRKHPARYMLTITISGVCYAVGLFMRIPFGKDTHNLTLYIVMNMFTVLSPCGFIATVYMLLGRLAIHLQAHDFLLVKPRYITKIFLTSDIVTLLIQAAGGSMVTNADLSKMGTKIFLAGLIIQLISFIFYTIVYVVFLYRMKVHRPSECRMDFSEPGFFGHWTMLAGALAISCIGIIIRSVFRTIENAQGFHGYLATHEGYFYALDTLPLFVAIAVFIITWPPMYLTGYKTTTSMDTAHEMGGVISQ